MPSDESLKQGRNRDHGSSSHPQESLKQGRNRDHGSLTHPHPQESLEKGRNASWLLVSPTLHLNMGHRHFYHRKKDIFVQRSTAFSYLHSLFSSSPI